MLSLPPQVRARIEALQRVPFRAIDVDAPDTQIGVLLWGTLGYAAYVRVDGSVWIEEEGTDDSTVTRRLASEHERAGAFHKAAEQFPEFAAMVPGRPQHAPLCATCAGAGRWRLQEQSDASTWCGDCDGLGWLDATRG